MWLPFQLGQVTEHSCWKRFSKYQTQKKKRKNTTFSTCIRCHFPGRDPAADGFSGTFQLWCGVAGLMLDISGHQVHISAREPSKLYSPVIWQGALCAMVGLWTGIMLSLPSAAAQQREWLRPSSRRRISILRYLGCSFRYCTDVCNV